METLLVLGAETIVGANAAAEWRTSGRADVVAVDLSTRGGVTVEEARATVEHVSADRVLFCNAASEPAWSSPAVTAAAVDDFRVWVRAVRDAGVPLTFVSSDAVLTGPRLFHREDSTAHCGSDEAARVREMEDLLLRVMPGSLIVRTQAFGFSPSGRGGLESVVDGADVPALLRGCDPFAHATPILATDLAEVIYRAHEEEVTGLLHAGGAERVGRSEFVATLAAAFGRETGTASAGPSLATVAHGFGRGESALDSKRARDLLNLAAPLLREGVDRLVAAERDGWRSLVTDGRFAEAVTVPMPSEIGVAA